jgi:hypothetical protein
MNQNGSITKTLGMRKPEVIGATESGGPPLQASGRGDEGASPPPDDLAADLPPWAGWVLAAWLAGLTGATFLALLVAWSVALTGSFTVLGLNFTVTSDVAIIVLAFLAGTLGSVVHTLTRLTRTSPQAADGGQYPHHQALWFVANPIQGGILAVIAVAAVEAGLSASNGASSASTATLFAVVTLAAVAGLFSKRMTAKLAGLVNNGPSPGSA